MVPGQGVSVILGKQSSRASTQSIPVASNSVPYLNFVKNELCIKCSFLNKAHSCLYTHVSKYRHMDAGPQRSQKKVLGTLKLELQVFVKHPHSTGN